MNFWEEKRMRNTSFPVTCHTPRKLWNILQSVIILFQQQQPLPHIRVVCTGWDKKSNPLKTFAYISTCGHLPQTKIYPAVHHSYPHLCTNLGPLMSIFDWYLLLIVKYRLKVKTHTYVSQKNDTDVAYTMHCLNLSIKRSPETHLSYFIQST